MVESLTQWARRTRRRAAVWGRDPGRWGQVAAYAMARRRGGSTAFVRFVILSRSRTGSNLLASLLDDHPRVHALGEEAGTLEGRSPQAVLEAVYAPHPRWIRAVGFKLFYYHPVDGDPAAFRAGLRHWEPWVVHLRRENLLRVEVSRILAARNDVWSRRRRTRGSAEKVELRVDQLVRRFEQTRQWERTVPESLASRVCPVVYEDLKERPNQQLERVQRFLGVEPQQLHSPLKRQNPQPLTELVKNWSEVERGLTGTEWERYLERESILPL